ncbi:MAG: hypothetical protein ACRC1I_16115 [Pseudomonas proteolytica]|uniref:hypothetical protein n=1 Tax=Pseudomonas proteolytica TaxID=219574 RepID=UPI003F305AA9
MAQTSAAKLAANKRYNNNAYDHITIMVPKGTKDAIKATGSTINGYINKLIASDMERRQRLP